MAQRGQDFQKGLDAARLNAMEAAGDLVGGGFAQVVQGGADGGDLVGHGFGPRRLGGCLGRADIQRALIGLGGHRTPLGVLVVGAQPADQAARFLCRAFAVEAHQPVQDFIVGQVGRPAIGGGHFAVDLVMQVGFRAMDPIGPSMEETGHRTSGKTVRTTLVGRDVWILSCARNGTAATLKFLGKGVGYADSIPVQRFGRTLKWHCVELTSLRWPLG